MSISTVINAITGEQLDVNPLVVRKVIPNIPNGKTLPESYRVYENGKVNPLTIAVESYDGVKEALLDEKLGCEVELMDGKTVLLNLNFVRKLVDNYPNGASLPSSCKVYLLGEEEPLFITVGSAEDLRDAMAQSGGGGGVITADEISSGSADGGLPLVANGQGGVSWGKAQINGIGSEGEEAGLFICSDGEGGATWNTVKVLDTDGATAGYVLMAGSDGKSYWAQLGQAYGGDYVATFNGLAFSDDGRIEISYESSDERWDWMKATDKDCYLIIGLTNGKTIEMKRIRFVLTSGSEVVEFGSVLNVDGESTIFYYARFTSSGGIVVKDEGNLAKVDGSYPLMDVGKADVANNLTPYSDESGAFQDNPTISQGTGTDNNVSIVTTGNFAQLREKQGNTLVVNQLNRNLSGSSVQSGVTYTKNSDNSWTISGTATGGNSEKAISQEALTQGHKYFFFCSKPDANMFLTLFGNGVIGGSGSWGGKGFVGTASGSGVAYLLAYTKVDTAVNFTTSFYLIDITSWPADVIADLTAHPDHFSWYYNGPLTYNAGSLENSNGVKLVCTDRQLWDEEWEVGKIDADTGQNAQDANCIRSKNYINIVPNKPLYWFNGSAFKTGVLFFYDKDKNYLGNAMIYNNGIINAPSNAVYLRFRLVYDYGTTYNHDVTVSLYYTPQEGGEVYDQYYPYKEPTVVDTGNEPLYGVEGSRDGKAPDGTITRRRGRYTFTGNETWSLYESSFFYCNISLNNNALSDTLVLCSNGLIVRLYTNSNTCRVYITENNLTTSSNMNSLFSNGTTIEYDLANPTTEEGTPFPENVTIDDYGMMYWLDENDELVGIPQGAKFFYPVNYKGFTDDLYNRTEGDAGKLVIQSELSAEDTKVDGLYAIMQANVGGALRHQLADKANIDFANTKWIDLGDLTFSEVVNGVIFKATLSDGKYGTNLICPLFKTVSSALTGANEIFFVDSTYGEKALAIRIGTSMTETAFNAFMKGVLLAYEKA